MSNNRPKVELTEGKPQKLKLLHDKPLEGKNGHGPYAMYGVVNEAGEELVWFAPASAHEVIKSQQLKKGSEIIVKLVGKDKVEVSIVGNAAEPDHSSCPMLEGENDSVDERCAGSCCCRA